MDRKPKTMGMCFEFAKGYALDLEPMSRLKLLHLLADAKFLQMNELQDAVELALQGELDCAIPSQSRPTEQEAVQRECSFWRQERVAPNTPPEPRCCVLKKEGCEQVCEATFPTGDQPNVEECPVECQIPVGMPPLQVLQTMLDPSMFVPRRRPMQRPQPVPVFQEGPQPVPVYQEVEEPVPHVRTKRFQKLDEFINRY